VVCWAFRHCTPLHLSWCVATLICVLRTRMHRMMSSDSSQSAIMARKFSSPVLFRWSLLLNRFFSSLLTLHSANLTTHFPNSFCSADYLFTSWPNHDYSEVFSVSPDKFWDNTSINQRFLPPYHFRLILPLDVTQYKLLLSVLNRPDVESRK
jgi:hypothetical protein